MSPRYYLGTTILVAVLTFAISVWKQKNTKGEIFLVMVKVILALTVIGGVVFGVAQLLAFLGISQSGFFI